MFHFVIGAFLIVVAFGLFPHVATALFKLGAMLATAGVVIGGILVILQMNHML
jgi:hypothetical protein